MSAYICKPQQSRHLCHNVCKFVTVMHCICAHTHVGLPVVSSHSVIPTPKHALTHCPVASSQSDVTSMCQSGQQPLQSIRGCHARKFIQAPRPCFWLQNFPLHSSSCSTLLCLPPQHQLADRQLFATSFVWTVAYLAQVDALPLTKHWLLAAFCLLKVCW